VYAFTALINAYGRNGQHEASLHLLARMKREKVTPNIITYNTVINASAKGGLEWEGLLGLFAQMRHEGVQPDIITYNTLLSACSRLVVDSVRDFFCSERFSFGWCADWSVFWQPGSSGGSWHGVSENE
jgi:pentatricopeptide repeat protein